MGELEASVRTSAKYLDKKWPVPSKQLVNPPEERLQGSSLPPRLPGSLLHPLEEPRSPTDTGQELWLFVRSEDTRSPPNFWSEKSLRISKLISDFSLPPLALSRRLVRLISLVCLRTPICAQFMPSVSPLCQRTSNWPEESVERELRCSSSFFSSVAPVFIPDIFVYL